VVVVRCPRVSHFLCLPKLYSGNTVAVAAQKNDVKWVPGIVYCVVENVDSKLG
jgi:hypothetical protein